MPGPIPSINVFNTPDNERSFSALIDRVVMDTGRPTDLRALIGYANTTIRECQTRGLFSGDMLEIEVPATANPHIYVKPPFFRSIRSARYASQNVYPKLRVPGRQQSGKCHYFYAVDDSFVFAGPLVGETIQMATMFWKNPLTYYSRFGTQIPTTQGGPFPIRKAFYDLDQLKWQYLNLAGTAYVDTLADPVEEDLRRRTSLFWMLFDWWDLIIEGTKAKAFKGKDDSRAVMHYANYKRAQNDLALTTGFDAEVGAMLHNDD